MRFLLSCLLICVGLVSGQPLGGNNNAQLGPMGNNPININNPLNNNPLSSMNPNNPLMMNGGLPSMNQPLSGINQALPSSINQALLGGMNAINNPLLPQQNIPPQQNLFPQQQPQIFSGLPNDRIRELALQAAQPTLQQWLNNDPQAIFQRAGALNPLPNQPGQAAPPVIEGIRTIQAMPSTLSALQQQLQSPIGQGLLSNNPNLASWMQQQQLLMQQAINRPVSPLDQLQQQGPPINNIGNINPNPSINAPNLQQGLNTNINRPPFQDFTLMQPGPNTNINPNINPQPIINNPQQPINFNNPPVNNAPISMNAPQPNNAPGPRAPAAPRP